MSIQINTCIARERKKMIKQKNTKYDEYQSKLNDIAEQKCKSKQEWKAEEITYTKSDYMVNHKSVGDLQERYQRKLFNYQRTELKVLDKIKDCERRIERLQKEINILQTQHYPRKLKKKLNQLAYQKGYKVLLENYLCKNESKQKRYEYLCMKWTGIMQKIILADLVKEIWLEKSGLSYPYYGFGDDRETSPYIHEDNK